MILVVTRRQELVDAIEVSVDGHLPVRCVRDPRELLSRSQPVVAAAILVDLTVDRTRAEVIYQLRRCGVTTSIVAIVATGDLEAARAATESGASRCVDELTPSSELRRVLIDAMVPAAPTEPLRDVAELSTLVGEAPAMRALKVNIRRVAPTELAVLINGETGSGKELVARALHALSPRARRAFVAVNAAAIAPGVVESELFGSVAGAYTGARNRRGLLRSAHGGTLFLDEISELPLELQPKLLRVIENGEVVPVGSDSVERVDVRIVAAGNRDFQAMVRAGTFRADLWYRLSPLRLDIPPLRDRVDDIPRLARELLRRRHMDDVVCSSGALVRLQSHRWPGNVRELENVLVRSAVLSGRSRIRSADLVFDDDP